MPHSDDLYSEDGELDHDYADELSPSDGYFASGASSNAVPNVPNVIVPDPTIPKSETKAAEAKAQEADEESLLNTRGPRGDLQPQALSARDFSSYAQSSAPSTRSDSTRPVSTPPTSYAPSSYTAPATRRPLRTHQAAARTPSLYSEAPPAYSPSQTTPLSPSNQANQSTNYGSVTPDMGIENERLLGRDPESMGEPEGEDHRYLPRWRRRITRRSPRWLTWKVALLGLFLLFVTIGFLTTGYKAVKNDNGKSIGPLPPPNGDTTRPTDPDQPEQPSQPSQPGSPNKEPLQATFCRNAKYRFPDQIMSVRYGKGQNLTFIQDLSGHAGNVNVKVGGQVNIRELDDGGDPRVVLEIVTSEDMLRLNSFIDEDTQTMKIQVPKKFQTDNYEEQPCVEMRATIWVPRDAELQQFFVSTIHLDVLTFDNLAIKVDDYSKLTSIVGDIVAGAEKPRSYDFPGLSTDGSPDFTFIPAKDSYTFNSRVIEVTSTTGGISGNWPLYDFLGLHVTSGDIKVSITPETALESDPKPAVLSISSVSGAIRAAEPIHEQNKIPTRNYLIDIKSTSGGIHSALAFGEGIELKSTASDIAADLLPVLDSDTFSPTNPAQLETVTTSGATAIRILEPIWYGLTSAAATPEMNCLQAGHKSTSGNIGIRYPQSWVGDLQAETTSGKLSVKGKDVKITRAGGGWPSSKLQAYKGKSGGGSTILVNTMLGNMDATIGDV